jgi:TDG/mug DNA glycosylase family protein
VKPDAPWRPTAAQLEAAKSATLRDVIADDLNVLFCGINPSLYSAAVGHHFARPGNRFWPALWRGGWTDRVWSPFEDRRLLEIGCGVTNLAARPTATADLLDPAELLAGAKTLATKVKRRRVKVLAVLGVTAYRAGFAKPDAQPGLQPETIGGAAVWILPNPSGLNAHYSLERLGELFSELRLSLSRYAGRG